MRNGILSVLVSFVVAQIPCFAPAAAAPQEPREGPILGAPSAFDLSGEREETLWVEAETELHQEPAPRSPTLTRVGAAVELPVVERRGAWVRVRFGSWLGWVRAADPASRDGIDADLPKSPPTAPAWLPRSGPDPDRLRSARSILREERVEKVGPYDLYTDIPASNLLARLSQLADRLPEIFHERYGLLATPGAGESVVLYARDESYRQYIAEAQDPPAVESLGHAAAGLAVFALGDRRIEELEGLLLHELTHLLTYRALGPSLPPWLVEGLAEDLAYCRTTPQGEILPGSLKGFRSSSNQTLRGWDGRLRYAVKTELGGPQASLEMLRRKWRDPGRPSFAELLELSSAPFMAPEQRSLHYAMSAFLVRYLLASVEYADRFRALLRAVAQGARGDGADVLRLLETDWAQLEAGFADWLVTNAPLSGAKWKKGKP